MSYLRMPCVKPFLFASFCKLSLRVVSNARSIKSYAANVSMIRVTSDSLVRWLDSNLMTCGHMALLLISLAN